MHLFFEKKENANRNLIEHIILNKYNQYYRLAYSYVHNEADAGDIVQNGAYKALRNADLLQNPEYAETWIYRIMLNECFRFVRQNRFLSFEAIEEKNGAQQGYQEDHDTSIDLQRAIDTLHDKDKAIVILRFYEEKTIEEIAEILNENRNTVKSRLYRSMKKLREVLSDKPDHLPLQNRLLGGED